MPEVPISILDEFRQIDRGKFAEYWGWTAPNMEPAWFPELFRRREHIEENSGNQVDIEQPINSTGQ